MSNRSDSQASAVRLDPAVVREVLALVGDLAVASAEDPDSAFAAITTDLGCIDVLPHRPGRTDPSRAWSADTDWAALIIYPGDLGDGSDPAEVYIFPRHVFTEEAWATRGTFQLVDHEPGGFCGVLWVDLRESAYDNRHALLGAYRVALPALESGESGVRTASDEGRA